MAQAIALKLRSPRRRQPKQVGGNSRSHRGNPLDSRNLPLKRPKFCKPAEVARVGREHANPQPSGTRRDQRVVGESSPADFFEVIFRCQKIEDFPSLRPVTKIWNK